jgi:hypothetical protein
MSGLVRSLPQSACQARVREITLQSGGLMSFGWGKPTIPVTAQRWWVSCAAPQQFGLHQEPGNRLRCSGERADFNPPMTGRREMDLMVGLGTSRIPMSMNRMAARERLLRAGKDNFRRVGRESVL